ncbi:antitermination NusB domain-containing protein [Actinidia rufa]|uniref:Antitermination NusB domain-containing protein n=1 Tax=Actinidia rufa TaxID=165716 RepID=A0A7J0H502_9ERIC|nr:antitermination NusB domain-containing protein [Actinidia rufa]
MEATSSWRRPYVHRRHLILQEFVSNSSPLGRFRWVGFLPQRRSFPRSPTLRVSTLALEELMENPPQALASSPKDSLPKIDKCGRFCSPRAARELALLITYAACLEGSDPVRLFEKRMNARREPGYEFDKTLLTKYNHMSFGGPPVTVETVEEANELMRNEDKESAIESQIIMYFTVLRSGGTFSSSKVGIHSKLILRFTRKLLVAIVERWNSHVLVIDKVAPSNWKNEPAGRILEFCILHLAMSEITVLGTRHQIVINEAVDIAKRFCDGAAPRIINGCLRTFVTDLEENGTAQGLEGKQILFH